MNLTVGIPHSTTLNLFPQTRIRISTIKSIQYNPPHPPKKVVVCGGGVIGVCTAYFLAMKGAAVTLIEKSKIACAASGKAGGFLALDWCDGGPIEQLARTSFNLPCSLSQELNGSRSYGYRSLSALSLTVTEESKRSSSSTSSSSSELLPSCLMDRPVGLRRLGLTKRRRRCTRNSLPGRLLRTPWRSMLQRAPLDPEVYPHPTGEVYVCGVSKEEEVPDNPEEIRGDNESIEMLKRVAKTVSTHLGEEGLKVEQACFLPGTDDGVPIIGEITGVKGCYVATGHSRWGILNGPATGAAVAELVLDGHSTIVDLEKFSPARFAGCAKA
ncbi:unnamed protein product [Vicia faba]|uniref:FAD dependent oxidoreductase domain-containing protein n=1 Tax=Vicia faba TaxID=3906 RepID=A0AAV1AFS3_VICFA|nr:unnamed protein product [Vicia faba]